MKILGIIGGIGPESTMEYYRTIIKMYRERKGDGSYPPLLINSIDLKKEVEMLERGHLEALADFMLEEVKKLGKAGADFALFASNTPHCVRGSRT